MLEEQSSHSHNPSVPPFGMYAGYYSGEDSTTGNRIALSAIPQLGKLSTSSAPESISASMDTRTYRCRYSEFPSLIHKFKHV